MNCEAIVNGVGSDVAGLFGASGGIIAESGDLLKWRGGEKITVGRKAFRLSFQSDGCQLSSAQSSSYCVAMIFYLNSPFVTRHLWAIARKSE